MDQIPVVDKAQGSSPESYNWIGAHSRACHGSRPFLTTGASGVSLIIGGNETETR